MPGRRFSYFINWQVLLTSPFIEIAFMHYPKTFRLFALTLLFQSCKKNETNTTESKDLIAPAITITTPFNNQLFSSGQVIQITANATDNVKVTELHIHVTNKTSGALLRDIHSYPGDRKGTVQDSFSAQAGVSYTIKIIAFDPAQNLATAQVDVSVN